MITALWWQVKATTVQKCFETAGFVRNSGASDTAAASDDVTEVNADDVWSDLIKNNCVDERMRMTRLQTTTALFVK